MAEQKGTGTAQVLQEGEKPKGEVQVSPKSVSYWCPLILGRCFNECIFYMATNKDSDVVAQRLAGYYRNCYLMHYIIISLRVRGG